MPHMEFSLASWRFKFFLSVPIIQFDHPLCITQLKQAKALGLTCPVNFACYRP